MILLQSAPCAAHEKIAKATRALCTRSRIGDDVRGFESQRDTSRHRVFEAWDDQITISVTRKLLILVTQLQTRAKIGRSLERCFSSGLRCGVGLSPGS